MQWKYVKPLLSSESISDFETVVKYKFPDDFKKCVLENNGGRPDSRTFDTDRTKERELKSFLSFNKDDIESIWKISEWNKSELSDKYVAFAIDNFGNLICFDIKNNNIIFLDHETLNTEKISDDFTGFLNGLYS